MGVDTKGITKVSVNPLDIAQFLYSMTSISLEDRRAGKTPTVSGISIHPTFEDKFHQITFKYKGEDRMISVFWDGNCKNDYADVTSDSVTLLSLGCWGSSEEIIRVILDHFGGGWIDVNDCDEEDYVPV